jgi:hypothetical protein
MEYDSPTSIDDLVAQYKSQNAIDLTPVSTLQPVAPAKPAPSGKTILVFKWIAVVVLFMIAISALVLAALAYTKTSLSASDQATLQEVAQKVSFDGNILVAAGFSDAVLTTNSRAQPLVDEPFTVSGGSLKTQTVEAAGSLTSNGTVVAGTGFTLQQGDLSATESVITALGVNTTTLNLPMTTNSAQTASLTSSVFTMGDSSTLVPTTMTMQPSSLAFTNSAGKSTSITALGITVPNQNLMGLRFLGNGPTVVTPTPGSTTPTLIGPVTFTNTYGSLTVLPADLVPRSTFEISFEGSFVNISTSGTQLLYLTLVNGSSLTSAQTFIGRPPPLSPVDVTLSVPVTTGLANFGMPSDTAAFSGRYVVTLQAIGSGTVTVYTSGELTMGCTQVEQNTRSFSMTYESLNSTMVATSGFNFTLWATWNGNANVSTTLRRMSLVQLI